MRTYRNTGLLIMTFSSLIHRIGLLACILLVIACFLPWTYYADPHIATEAERTFTGYHTYHNQYGRPGKFLTFFAVIIFAFMLLPKIWAKRANLFIAALGVGYAIKSFVLFAACYNAYCPERRLGLYLMVVCSVLLLVAAAFPDMKLSEEKKD